MLKVIKRVIFGSLSVLIVSTIFLSIALLNPSMTYANKTSFDKVTVYHNQALEKETESIINNAIEIIKSSELYTDDIKIDLCLNDGSYYPEFHPLKGGIAYSFLNKSLIYNSKANFKKNESTYQWEENENELRKVDLTWLLAHEFTHNLQFNMKTLFQLDYDFWQQEGYAEYISRQWKNDNLLKEKIQFLLEEEQKEHKGFPVFEYPDGTVQLLSYYKYALMVQYLTEQKDLNFEQFPKHDLSFERVYNEMIAWGKQ